MLLFFGGGWGGGGGNKWKISGFRVPLLKCIKVNAHWLHFYSFELGVGAGRVGLSLLDASGVYTTIGLGNYLDREDLYEQIRDLVLLNRTSTSDNAIGKLSQG